MNQGEEPYEIPIPWFLIKHPQGDVIIDGGMPIEAALDKHKHWGSLVDVYDPVMKASEWCRDQVKTVNTNPEDVKKCYPNTFTLRPFRCNRALSQCYSYNSENRI